MAEGKHEVTISDLDKRTNKVEEAFSQIKQTQDESFIIQNATLKKLNEIQICLAGTEYDRKSENGHGGGVVKRLSKGEKSIDELQIWRTRVTTRNGIIWIIVGGVLTFISTVIVTNWQNIFKGN